MRMPVPPGDTRPVIVTSCHGERFWAAVPHWARHLHAAMRLPIRIVSLDGGSFDDPALETATVRVPMSRELGWASSDLPRLGYAIGLLKSGRICVQVDIDVLVHRDLAPLIGLDFDFIISRGDNFPKRVGTTVGFTACSGLYIAKPSALRFCEEWMSATAKGRFGSSSDQWSLNHLLLAPPNLPPRRTGILPQLRLGAAHEARWGETSVCILPGRAIARRGGPAAGVFGNHGPGMIDHHIQAGG